MIENQSGSKQPEDSESEKENSDEKVSLAEDQVNDPKDSNTEKSENIDADDIKNTVSNNDARLEQLEKEHETLKSQYVRIAADFENFRKGKVVRMI